MRRFITGLSAAAVVAAAIAMPTLASAEPAYGRREGPYVSYGAPLAGAAVGTAVGVGLANGWYGAAPAIAGTALPTTAAGAAAVGGVAGIGTVALIDGVVQPCRGFHALFGANREACVDGQYVGYAPRAQRYYR